MHDRDEKTARFAEIIGKSANKKCKAIRKKTEDFRTSELKNIEEKSEKQLQSKLKYEIRRIETETNREISSFNAESVRKTVEVRNEITDKVFKAAEKELISFVSSSEYIELLEKSILKLYESIDGFVYFFVRKEDEEKARLFVEKNNLLGEVRISDKIRIGGAFACDENESIFAYDTLERRLEEQREVFMESSGLAINI